MLETLIYIVHEINLEQIKLTTTINQLIKRINQNELYLNQLNINIETLYEQYHVRNCKFRYFVFFKDLLYFRLNNIQNLKLINHHQQLLMIIVNNQLI
jgi:hypothetical protein